MLGESQIFDLTVFMNSNADDEFHCKRTQFVTQIMYKDFIFNLV